MRKNIDLQPSWRERLRHLWSRFRFLLAMTSPFWIFVLLIDGSLSLRLLGAGVMLLIFVCVLYSYRWVAYAAGLLWAIGQRLNEKKKGELDNAKKY